MPIPRLILFAKYPEPGRVKTRLAASIGPARAAHLYKEMVETIVRQTDPVVVGGAYERILYFDPPKRADDFRAWLPQIAVHSPQSAGDLGARMSHACAACLQADHHRVCIIGTDCIHLTATDIAEAFASLEQHDLVIGPATDGGYYLLGMNHMIPTLFDDIPWSTDLVYATTRRIADRLQLRVRALPLRRDIDTIADLR